MDLKTEITNRIIEMLEAGVARGAESLWNASGWDGMPRNYKTRRPYSGINVPLLWMAAMERGFTRQEWLTFNQARELGARIKKGAKGVMVIYFKMVPRKDANDEAADEQGMVPLMRAFWLFNVADVEGLPALEESATAFEPMELAEQVLQASGARISWAGARAFYRLSTDEIVMPDRERFSEPVNAYAVALHELTHWTGHSARLNRDFTGRFGSESYAFEELVAELGSAFLVAHLGLKGANLENHASYIQSWLQVLRNDKNAIFTASRHAQAAYQFILERAGLTFDADETTA